MWFLLIILFNMQDRRPKKHLQSATSADLASTIAYAKPFPYCHFVKGTGVQKLSFQAMKEQVSLPDIWLQ